MKQRRHDMSVTGSNAGRLALLAFTVLCAGLFWCLADTAMSASGSKPAPTAATEPGHAAITAERRVMFDEGHEWATSKAATDKVIDRLKAAGFNVYVPCVWHGRGTTWPSRLAYADSRLPQLSWSGHDPLAYLLEKAHAAGIEVHPWFTVVRRDDSTYRQFYSAATPQDAYDVHNKAFRHFIVELMLDVVQRYPVDGINLDYIRSMGDCSCGQCAIDYRKKFGRDLVADIATKQSRQLVPSLAQWHGEAVSEIVREIAERGRKLKPGLVLSVDGHPLSPDLLRQGQDSVAWERKGWINVVYSMDYRQQPDMAAAKKARQAFANPEALTLLFSIYDLVPPDESAKFSRQAITGHFGDKVVVSREPELLAQYVHQSRQFLPGGGAAFYHLIRFTAEQANTLRDTVYHDAVAPHWPVSLTMVRPAS